MSLPVPLSVRIRTGARDVHLTDELDGLSFGTTSPGGFADCTMSLRRPIAWTPGEIRQFARVYVYDARSRATVWEGRLQDPGRTAGSAGEEYQLAAVGGQAHFQDATVPYILLDRRVSAWAKRDDAVSEIRTATVQTGDELGGTGRDTIYLTIPSGTKLTQDKAVTAVYRDVADAGMELALVDYVHDEGFTSGSWAAEMLLGNGTIYRTTTPSTAGEGYSTRTIGLNWPAGQTTPMVRLRWISATPVTLADDVYWMAVVAPIVAAVRYSKAGIKQVSGYTSADHTILASTVVQDLLGRLLTGTINGVDALVMPSAYGIEQLAYPDGVTPAQVLADLLEFEPGFTWHVWESTVSDDRFGFEWIPWPSSVRYETDAVDGFTASGSGASLFNQVMVRYRDSRGRIRSVTRASSVPTLTDAGLTRTGYLDLGEQGSTQADAIRAGDQWLTEHNTPVNAGRLVVRQPVLDMQLGRMVDPWELRAGSLIRVRGVDSYPDSLNVTGRDGATVFRMVSTRYSTADATATVELDAYAPSVARALATLAKQTKRR